MKYYDISAPFSTNLPIYPGDPIMTQNEICDITKGDVANVSELYFGSHTGTHLDVPKHFFANGKSLDQVPIEKFIGVAKVFEIKGKDSISYNDICNLNIENDDIILFKTDNNEMMLNPIFKTDFVYLSYDAAKFLVEKNIRAVGIDYLSIEKYNSEEPIVHRTLLGNDIYIIEGLILSKVKSGVYNIIALPLNIPNGNGSPVRVILTSK